MSLDLKSRKITRRDMLRMTGTAGIGLLAAACGQAAPAAEPQIVEVEKQVVVEKEVVRTVEVEKVVEKEVAVEKIVEVTSAPSEGGITIDGALWVLQGQDFHPSYNEYLRAEITNYSTANDWPLDISYIAGFTSGSGEVEKIAAAVQSGNPPDMVLHTLSAVQLRNLYALDPVNDVVEEITSVFGDPSPYMNTLYELEGQWWAVPYHQRSDGGWYRRDIFDAAGIDLQQTRRYDLLAEQTLEVSDPANELYGWGMTVNRSGDGDFLINRVKTGWGASWQDETGQFITTNSPEMVEAMTFLRDVYSDPANEDMLPPGVLAWNDISNNEAYLGGIVAFTQNAGTVYAKAVVDENPVAPLTGYLKPPGGPVLEEFFALGAKNWMVLRGAKNAAAAKNTILHFNADIDRYDEMLASSPAYAIPCYTDIWDMSSFVANDEVLQQQKVAALDPSGIDTNTYPGPLQPAMSGITEAGIWNDMVNAMLTGTAVEDAVAEAHDRMVVVFKDYGLPGEQT